MFRTWYQPHYHMEEEDWIYIVCLAISWILATGLGLVIGLVIC